jgi:hypothetical protein
MQSRVAWAIAFVLLATTPSLRAQRAQPTHPDLQGTWNGATLTPLQRPAEFKDKQTFTPDEAAEFVRTREDRLRSRFPTPEDRLTQADIDDVYTEVEAMPLDRLRTSLIVDPPSGVLPPQLPAAQQRIAARPKRAFDAPETFNLAERCLLANPGNGGSAASPPLTPSQAFATYFQIVQTADHVMIFSEWIHDVRVVRMNGAHLPPSVRKWLGDSVGQWDGDTLVIDTTNFRPDVHNLDSGERLHVVERITKIDEDTLEYRVTSEDPDTWATPWTAEWRFRRTDAKLFEVACHEGNFAIEGMLRGARAEEQSQPAAGQR